MKSRRLPRKSAASSPNSKTSLRRDSPLNINEDDMLPEVKALLQRIAEANTPDIVDLPLMQARLAYEASCALLDKKGPAIAQVRDFDIEGPAGPIPARLYDPTPGSTEATNALVFYHGGGFVIGNLSTHDGFVRRLCDGLNMPAIAVDYRLAPEHPFPAAIEDCIAATQWAAKGLGPVLGREIEGLVIAGDSAGGNSAAVVANTLKDTSSAPIILQVLLYPATDSAREYPSHKAHVEGKMLEQKAIDFFAQAYIPPGTDLTDPRLSPIYAALDDHIPPAIIVVAELDPLYDEGLAYAKALQDADVVVDVLDERGLIHGFYTLRGALPTGDASVDRLITAIEASLKRHHTP